MRRLGSIGICILVLCLLTACQTQGEPHSAPASPPPTQTPEPTAVPTATPAPLPYEGTWVLETEELRLTLYLGREHVFLLTCQSVSEEDSPAAVSQSGTFREEKGQLCFVYEGGSFTCGFALEGDSLLLYQEGFVDLTLSREVTP